jgi:hypothetical protein
MQMPHKRREAEKSASEKQGAAGGTTGEWKMIRPCLAPDVTLVTKYWVGKLTAKNCAICT